MQTKTLFLGRKLCSSGDDESLTYRYTIHEEVPSKGSALFFALQATDPDEIKENRRKGAPGFVMKRQGVFYYGSVPFNSDIKISNGTMVEAIDLKDASELFPDLGPNAHLDQTANIESGYETFNTGHDRICFLEYKTTEEFSTVANCIRFYNGCISKVRITNNYLATVIKNVRYPSKETKDKVLISSSTQVVKVLYTLAELSEQELPSLRRSGQTGIIIKTDGKYWYSPIKFGTNFSSNLLGKVHKCCHADSLCDRLSALPDEEGGCEKVRAKEKCLEDYPWIPEGYEIFNNSFNDVFIITECEHCFHISPNTPRNGFMRVNTDCLNTLVDRYGEED